MLPQTRHSVLQPENVSIHLGRKLSARREPSHEDARSLRGLAMFTTRASGPTLQWGSGAGKKARREGHLEEKNRTYISRIWRWYQVPSTHTARLFVIVEDRRGTPVKLSPFTLQFTPWVLSAAISTTANRVPLLGHS